MHEAIQNSANKYVQSKNTFILSVVSSFTNTSLYLQNTCSCICGGNQINLQNWQNLVSDLLLEEFHIYKFICQTIIIINIINIILLLILLKNYSN